MGCRVNSNWSYREVMGCRVNRGNREVTGCRVDNKRGQKT